MGPLLVLICPCFRENVIVTCKIVSFLCSFDNFLLKNVIVFFFGNQISKWCSEKKRLFLTYFSHFLVTRKRHKNSFSTYLTYIHISCIFSTRAQFKCFPIDFFCFSNFAKITNSSCMVSLWYASWCGFLFAPFWSNQ